MADPFTKPSFAPRLRYFCEYLTRRGWVLDVYTEKCADIPFEHTYPIHEIPFYRNRVDWMVKAAWSLLTDWKDRYFTRQVRRQIAGKQYDAVFCTTFSTFPLGTALAISKERSLPLYVDIRDLDEQMPKTLFIEHNTWWSRPFQSWYIHINRCRRNRAIRAAKCVTTISPWHVDFIRQLNPNVHLIYNGYDPSRFYPKDVRSDKFMVSYLGRFYQFRNIEPIRQAIDELGNPEIVLNLHTPDHNPLPISAVLDEMHRSSIMVVLTSNYTKGVMTTKFYEALGCEKPVLCYPDDHGILAETIRRTNAGVVVDTVEEIQQFILTKYAEWKQNGFTRQQVIQPEKEAFSREHEAQQLEELLCC